MLELRINKINGQSVTGVKPIIHVDIGDQSHTANIFRGEIARNVGRHMLDFRYLIHQQMTTTAHKSWRGSNGITNIQNYINR